MSIDLHRFKSIGSIASVKAVTHRAAGWGRRALAVVATLAAVASVTACGQMKTADEVANNSGSSVKAGACVTKENTDFTGTLRIGWQSIPNADLVVKDQKLLESCLPKAKIEWSQFNSGADTLQAFGAKSLDIALLGSSPTVKAASAPLNLPIKAVWINDVIGDAESLVAKDGISSIKDLKGKTVAVPFGSTSHFSLLSALQDAGLSESDVKLINLDPDKIPAAWQRGEIDAAWIWDPVQSQLKKDGAKPVTSSAQTAKLGAPTYDLEVAATDFITKNPSVLETWTAVENHAIKQVAAGDAKAIDSIASQLGIEPAQVKEQLKGYDYPDAAEQEKTFTDDLPATFKKTAEFLKEQNGIDSVNDGYDSALYADAIKQVAKQ